MKTKITYATSLLTGATVEFHEPIADDIVGEIFMARCLRCGMHPCGCKLIVQTPRQRTIHRVLFG